MEGMLVVYFNVTIMNFQLEITAKECLHRSHCCFTEPLLLPAGVPLE